ncbi:hypothetical protein Glove_152g106 [Diversispora epigaea]|uniref:Uncharacterized protein n=1 Tax=Diversispora epigaea TaxID=1348612 RepID=A0A397J2G2_9GLOM|nr:hypothetical protein Glove_152g106 [Diversispora epigaea]
MIVSSPQNEQDFIMIITRKYSIKGTKKKITKSMSAIKFNMQFGIEESNIEIVGVNRTPFSPNLYYAINDI